jgi:hypothetical protein
MEISQDEFQAYEDVRKSGKTNMFITSNVEKLSNFKLGRDQIIFIMTNYSKLCKKYPTVRKLE